MSLIAKFVLRKYRPTIVAITGSVGKTTVKHALRAVLSREHTVRVSAASGNDYAGALRTILDGGFVRGLALLLRRDPEYPRVLLLEYGVDRGGDMERLLSLAIPDIGVVTSLAPVQLDTARSLERMIREKSILVSQGKRDGWTVLAYDDEQVRLLKARARGRIMTYGLDEAADVRAIEISINQEVQEGRVVVKGTNFKLVYKGSAVPVHLAGVVGGQHIAGALAAAAVGVVMNMNLVSISEGLGAYTPTPGRMRLLDGIKRTLIIDDTYTASPVSCTVGLNGLDALAIRPGSEKFAVLGDMVPLGEYTEAGHREVGEKVAAISVDYLITVGKLSRDIGHAAREKGMPEERVYHFTTPEEAGRFIQNRLEEVDCVYVAGNEAMRMEKIVKEIMAEPLKADSLLVRR